MKKWMTVLSVITAVLGIAVPVSAATSNSVVIAEYRTELSQYFGEKFEPPYGINSNNTEIDRGTAAVNTREVDISLPGKNGLDLNFIRTQSSLNTEAKFHHQSGSAFTAHLTGVYYTCEKDGVTQTYLIGFDREDDIFNHETLYARESLFRSTNYLTAKNGMKFYRYGDNKVTDRESDTTTTLVIDKTIAPVQLNLNEETFHTAKQNIKRTELSKDTLWEIDYKPEFVIELEDGYNERMHGYFKNEKGEVYQLHLIYWRMTSSESGHYSGAYVQKDSIDCDEHEVEMVTELVRNSYNCWGTDYNVPHERGFSYTLCVTDKMGKKYYFKAGSRLTTYSKMECQAVIDRYGNMIDYANGIDSMGRHFEVDKSGITVTAGNLTQKVFYQEERFNDDEKDPFGKMEFDDTYIFRVLKQETAGQEPAACDDVTEYRMKRYQMSEYSNEALWTYNAQIEQITYPTGGIEAFTYAPFEFNNGQASEREFVDRPLVSTYKNYEDGVLKSDKSFTYTFQTGDVMIEDFKEQNVSLGRTNTYTFDKYGRIDEVNFGYGSTYTKISYGYKLRDDSKRITSLISYNPIRQTRNYEYDSDGNITMSNDSFVEENSTYADYGLMLQSIYMRDTRYKIIVENTLTEDRNNIAKTDVYEADTTVTGRTLKETTSYTYDTYGNLASVTKNDGTRTVTTGYTYQYNTDGSYSVTQTLNNTTDADGNVTTGIQTATVYDSLGRPVSVTDANGNTTLTEYDLRNRITKVTNPDGTQQQITYDTANNTIIAQDELGAQTKYMYSPLGLLQYVYVKDGENWLLSAQRSYDTELRVSEETVYQDYSVTPPKSITAVYSYADSNELLSATAKDETGAVVQRVQYNYGKNIYVGTKQANAVTQTLTGDESITPNKIKTYTDVRGLVCMEEILNPSTNAVLYKNTYAYDLMGNLLETKDGRAWEEDWDYTQKMEYDYAGRMLKQYDALGNFAQNTYNQLGQLVTATDFNGASTNYTYDELGRTIQITTPVDDTQTGVVKQYYDKNGNLTKTAQLRGENTWSITENTYDARNRVTAVKHADGTYTQYAYDGAGNVTKMAMGATALIDMETASTGNTGYELVTYTYDQRGRLTAAADALNQTETYTYDLAGNTKTKTDRNGTVFGFTYDAMNRLLGQTAAGANGGTETIAYTYDAMGNVRTMADSSGTTTYTYDGFGRLTKEEKDGITKVYGYDTNGNRTQFTLTVNGVEQMDTSYTYDKLDRLETVTNGTVTSSYTYNNNGQLLTDTTGGFTTTYSYNAGGMVTNLITNDGTSQLQSHSYQYLPDGNISQKQSAVWTQGTQYNYQYSYFYDDAGRLEQENCNGDKKRYFYDAFGNRSKMMVSGPESWTENYTYDANNRLLKVVRLGTDLDEEVNYTYDANGNQLSWNKSVYTQTGTPEISLETDGNDFGIYGYDLYNRMTSYTNGEKSASYTYDGNNLRQSKTVNGVTTGHIWDGQNMVLETFGGRTKKYYRGANGIAHAELLGTVNYYLKDAHGDTAFLVDAAGEIAKNYIYDAFGNEQYTMADSNPFRYCGEYADRETGLLYLRNRYYDPSIGRFITEDPIQDGNNWYVYANNNPVMYIDPWGLESYILYIPEFEREAYEDRQDLIDMGVAEDEIIMVPLHSRNDFIQGWNNMGYILDEDGNRTTDEDGNYLTYDSIDYVIISTHGDPTGLGTGERSYPGWNLSSNDIGNLNQKDLTQNLLILACNAGHLDYKDTNPAAMFAQKVNGALVVASDGPVRPRNSDGFYQSYYDEEFRQWSDRNGAPLRDSVSGWIVYRQNSAGYVTTRVADSGSGKLLIWGAMQLLY